MSETIKNKREDEILNAARKVFTKKGYNNATMEDIIAETNLSKGGVYYYFKNKEDLCLALLYNVTVRYHDLSTGVGEVDKNDDPLRTVCDYYLNFLIEDSEEISIISSIYIDTRFDLDFRKNIAKKFNGNNVKHMMDYVNSHTVIDNQSLLESKLVYFMHVFHSMLYYKFIEDVDYFEHKDEIRDMFMSIFRDVE